MDEAERQRQVWDSLRRTISADEQVAVEFVFIVAPDDPVHTDEGPVQTNG